MLFLLIFPGTVKTQEKDQVGPQAQENLHDSSTDSCLTFPYSSDSPRPFPPSVHSVSDSPDRVSPLPIATSSSSSVNLAILSSIVHNLPTPVISTLHISMPSQTSTSVLFTPTTDSYNTPLYTPYSSSSFPQTGSTVFPGNPPDFPYFRTTLSGSDSTFPNTVSLPSYPMPSMVTPTTIPIPFFLLDLSPHLGWVLQEKWQGFQGYLFWERESSQRQKRQNHLHHQLSDLSHPQLFLA